jgi:hypothetical protein
VSVSEPNLSRRPQAGDLVNGTDQHQVSAVSFFGYSYSYGYSSRMLTPETYRLSECPPLTSRDVSSRYVIRQSRT